MKKTEKKKQRILFILAVLPIVSTNQIARLFPELKYPNKQASKCLKELERDKMVEGRDRSIGETKIWRLTRKARKKLELKGRAIPLTIRNVEHFLSIGDVYFDLYESGNLAYFQAELREEFVNHLGKKRKYSPDAFFIYDNEPFLLEVQRSYLSRKNWAEKWKIANDFIYEGRLQQSSISDFLRNEKQLPIVVVTEQNKDVVKTGTQLPLFITRNIQSLIS